MGNLPLSTGLFKTDVAVSEQGGNRRFTTRRISSGLTYFFAPITEARAQTPSPARGSLNPAPVCFIFPLSPTDPPPIQSSTADSSDTANRSHTSRPLLLFFSWLGAQPGGVAKYMGLYLDRGMDVLLVQSNIFHFLWPRWGLSYGLQVLKVLEEPPFSGRDVLVHASSIGGYTFTQMLIHISQEPKKHAVFTRRVKGQVYDSLVIGTLDHMATGLGKTLVPRFETFVRNAALFYFWLFRSHTARFYEAGIHVFYQNPLTSSALFFFSENDAMCNPAALETLMDTWRRRGVFVDSRKWAESTHAAHLRCHPEEYISTLQRFLNSIPASAVTRETS